MQTYCHTEFKTACERDAALSGTNEIGVGVERPDFVGKKPFETKGAGGVKDEAQACKLQKNRLKIEADILITSTAFIYPVTSAFWMFVGRMQRKRF